METFQYFPSSIHRGEEPEWLKTIQIEQGYWENNPENALVQTENLIHNETCFDFKKHVEAIATSILERDGYYVDAYQIKMESLWGQKLSFPANHYLHVHGNSVFSGFYILETTQNCPYPIFGDPRQGKLMGDLQAPPSNQINASTQFIHFDNLQVGSLFLFNSWLPHQFAGGVRDSEVKFFHFVINACAK